MVGHDGRGDHEHRGDYTRTVMAKMKTTMAMRLPIFLQRSTEGTRGLKS